MEGKKFGVKFLERLVKDEAGRTKYQGWEEKKWFLLERINNKKLEEQSTKYGEKSLFRPISFSFFLSEYTI